MTRRTCGHGRLLTHACPGCLCRVNPSHYWELRRLANDRVRARRRKQGRGAK